MNFFFPGAPQRDLYCRALDGLKDPAALLDADGRVLFANKALIRLQDCQTGGLCRNTGKRPCEGCLMADPAILAGDCSVWFRGRAYERSVTVADARKRCHAVMWHDSTAGLEAADLLRRQYDKMRRDIFHARTIQFSLLPKELIKADGYAFGALYKPSEEMSGDIFDLIRIGRDNVAFYIADVAGHGVTAAMLTMFFSTAVRLEMRPTDMPGRVLARVHNRFMGLQLEEQHYITAFLGRLELSTGRLFWSNAGHICPPILMDGAGRTEPLEMAGLPICRWFEDQEYATEAGQMEPGGRLVLFSDGLEAQWHSAGRADDLPETVGKIMGRTAPGECLEDIWRTAGEGAGGSAGSDDTTLLMVSRDSNGGSEGPT